MLNKSNGAGLAKKNIKEYFLSFKSSINDEFYRKLNLLLSGLVLFSWVFDFMFFIEPHYLRIFLRFLFVICVLFGNWKLYKKVPSITTSKFVCTRRLNSDVRNLIINWMIVLSFCILHFVLQFYSCFFIHTIFVLTGLWLSFVFWFCLKVGNRQLLGENQKPKIIQKIGDSKRGFHTSSPKLVDDFYVSDLFKGVDVGFKDPDSSSTYRATKKAFSKNSFLDWVNANKLSALDASAVELKAIAKARFETQERLIASRKAIKHCYFPQGNFTYYQQLGIIRDNAQDLLPKHEIYNSAAVNPYKKLVTTDYFQQAKDGAKVVYNNKEYLAGAGRHGRMFGLGLFSLASYGLVSLVGESKIKGPEGPTPSNLFDDSNR